MLKTYWHLTGQPFDKTIKPENLFRSQSVKELFSRLDYMKQQRGIMLIAGQPGMGKTTALRAFVSGLSELSHKTFYVPLATVNVLDFYRQLNGHLGGEPSFYKSQLYCSIQERIQDLVTHLKKIPVIIFDEAHLLKNENFTELQILANFNMDATDPALIILAGQPHLIDRLMRPVLKSFYQRITLKYNLSPLKQNEIQPYIEHQLALKGCSKAPFTQNAVNAIYKNTAGVPRLVGTLALNTMTLGMLENVTELTEEHVFQAAQEL
jgi:type II secretory pathway predicted ATPase ExeA